MRDLLTPRAAAFFVAAVIAASRVPAPTAAQGQGAGATAVRAPITVPPGTAKPVPPGPQDTYSYRPEGRRDPFVSLVARGMDPAQGARRAEGLAGLLAGDVVLKGIIKSGGRFIAIVVGPDGKRSYTVRPNDRFADGIVKAITADAMVILQEVNDPLSLTKQREIRKTLRAVEEVK